MDGVQRIIVVYKIAIYCNTFIELNFAAANNKPKNIPSTMEDPATKKVTFKNGNNKGIAFQMYDASKYFSISSPTLSMSSLKAAKFQRLRSPFIKKDC